MIQRQGNNDLSNAKDAERIGINQDSLPSVLLIAANISFIKAAKLSDSRLFTLFTGEDMRQRQP